MSRIQPTLAIATMLALGVSAQALQSKTRSLLDESSYESESLQHIRKGQPGSNFRLDTSHILERDEGFSDGLASVCVGGKWGFIDRSGRVVVEPSFSDAGSFREGLAPVERKGKWGYIDGNGRTVIPFVWDWAFDFGDGRALVKRGDLWGFIDSAGAIVVEPKFEIAYSFCEGLALVAQRTSRKNIEETFDWGYIGRDGTWVIKQGADFKYHPTESFSEGLARVHVPKRNTRGDRYWVIGFIDKTGSIVFELPTGTAGEFFEGRAQHYDNDLKHYGFIDRTGRIVIPMKYSSAGVYSEGLAPIELDEKWGFVDAQGEMVIGPSFEWAGHFSEGVAPAAVGEKWGFIDTTGRFVIEPAFDQVGTFQEGIAWVAVGGRVGYIDRDGKFIWRPTK